MYVSSVDRPAAYQEADVRNGWHIVDGQTNEDARLLFCWEPEALTRLEDFQKQVPSNCLWELQRLARLHCLITGIAECAGKERDCGPLAGSQF